MIHICPQCSQQYQGRKDKQFCCDKCRREWRKAQHLCTACSKPSCPNRTLCAKCAARNYKRVRRWWKGQGYGAIRYARDRKKGICLRCRKPHKPPPILCPMCQEQYKEYHKHYYEETKEQYSRRVATWRKRNPDKICGYQRKYHRTHQEQERAYQKRWLKENPDKAQLRWMHNRLRRKIALGECSGKQLRARINYYGGLCYLCGVPYEEIDHVIPIVVNPLNWPANLRPICCSCNASKGSKSLQDFIICQQIA